MKKLTDDERHARELRRIALKDSWPRWTVEQRDAYRVGSAAIQATTNKSLWHAAYLELMTGVAQMR